VSAIVVGQSPERRDGSVDPADRMPLHTRVKVAQEVNRLWAEFVNEMHDGPTIGPEVADKFWKFVTTQGRPT
jgi:hypothetical protein